MLDRFIPMKGHLMKQLKTSGDKSDATLSFMEPRKYYKRFLPTLLQVNPGLTSAVIRCWKIDIDKLAL